MPPDQRRWEWHYLKRTCAGSLFALLGHTSAVLSVGFSPDGQRLASASGDQTVKVWNARTGLELLTLTGHRGPVTSVGFSPDGQRLASASWDKTAKVWDVPRGSRLPQ